MVINPLKILLPGAANKKLKSFQDKFNADGWLFKGEERSEHRESLVAFSSMWVITQDLKSKALQSRCTIREDLAEVGKKQL